MRDETPPAQEIELPVIEASVPSKARNSGGVKCGGCGSENIGLNWMIFDIEASSGPRDHSFSYKPTVTRGFLLCPACYMSPASGTLRNAISDMYAVPAPDYTGCITLCTKPVKDRVLGVRKMIRRTWTKCPSCHRLARVFRIGVDETPHIVGLLARIRNL